MHYRYLILQLMASIERLTKELFHNSHTELWDEWLRLEDKKPEHQARAERALYNKMCKAFDSLNSDYVGI